MPLKIEMSPESVRPVVVCDGCGEPIADARDGNYQWQAPVDPSLSRKFVFFTHNATQPGPPQQGRGALSRASADVAGR